MRSHYALVYGIELLARVRVRAVVCERIVCDRDMPRRGAVVRLLVLRVHAGVLGLDVYQRARVNRSVVTARFDDDYASWKDASRAIRSAFVAMSCSR
jgi:hypothetical protein